MTIDEARSQAVTELRSVLELAPDHMAQEVPKPVANGCQVDGEKAVQFSLDRGTKTLLGTAKATMP